MPATTHRGYPLVVQGDQDADVTNADAMQDVDNDMAQQFGVRTVTATGAATALDKFIFGDATSGNITTTLPDPDTVPGQAIYLIRKDATGNYWHIVATGGGAVAANNPLVMNTQHGVQAIVADPVSHSWQGFGSGSQ